MLRTLDTNICSYILRRRPLGILHIHGIRHFLEPLTDTKILSRVIILWVANLLRIRIKNDNK